METDEGQPIMPERFIALAEAYGADAHRWPAAEREAARRLEASGDAVVRRALSRAAALDDLLDGYAVPAPTHALHRTIIATAPAAGAIWTRARLWWSGLGLAGAALAGAVAGASAIAVTAPGVSGSGGWSPYEATAFGDLGAGEDG